jgi:hypothetical protein
MSHSPQDQTTAFRLREQIDENPFFQLIAGTTLFRDVPLSNLPLGLLEKISREATVISIPKGEPVNIETTDPDKLVLCEILTGYVKIYDRPVSKSERLRGQIKTPAALLAWRVPNEILGDFQFICFDEAPNDYIEVTDDCSLLKVPARLVREVADTCPQIYLNIASNLAAKAIKARVRAQILGLPGSVSKVAQLFIELCRERNPNESFAKPQVLNGTFTNEDLNAFIGYKTSSTGGGIRTLIDRGYLGHFENQKTGRYVILDFAGLKEYVRQQLVKAAQRDKDKKR